MTKNELKDLVKLADDAEQYSIDKGKEDVNRVLENRASEEQLKFIEAIYKIVALRAKEFILKYVVDNLTDEMRKENDIKINSSINNDDSHVVNG